MATAGWSVSSAGDVNGDGYDDMIVGAPHEHNQIGGAYVIYGGEKQQTASVDLAKLSHEQGFKITGRPVVMKAGFWEAVRSAGAFLR